MKRFYSLFSGGVDSALATYSVLIHSNRCHMTPVFFNYGQRSASHEQAHAISQTKILQTLTSGTSSIIDDCRIYNLVPSDLFAWSDSDILVAARGRQNLDVQNRNMIFISMLTSIILSDRKKLGDRAPIRGQTGIIVGFKNEHYDTRFQFALLFNRLLNTKPFFVSVVTPLISSHQRRSFHSLAKRFVNDTASRQLVDNAWSCYFPTTEGRQCGKCPPCKARNHLRKEIRKRAEYKSR